MENGEVRQHILKFIHKRFPRAKRLKVNECSALLESGIIDSLAMLDVLSMLEKDFGIVILDEELVRDHFQTVVDIAKFVSRKLERKR